MAFVPVPKDLAQVKTKILFNLTKRQLICFGSGILIGLPLFFILKTMLPSSAAAIIMILVMLPCFLFGMYERNGQPLEKILHYFVQSRLKRPTKRPYCTENTYAALMRQAQLEKEVNHIVQSSRKQKRSRSETDQS